MMFRSTVYNRHEARRAKTLLRKGDRRPALLRVLGPPAGVTAALVVNSKTSSSTRTKVLNQQLDLQQQQQPHFASDDDDSIFTKDDMPGSKTHQDTSRSSVMASMMAASFGAALSETVYGARCLRKSSPFASSRVTVAGQPRIVMTEYASPMLQHTTRSVTQQPGASPVGGLFQGVSNAQLASRAAPFALLFGVKSAMEHLLCDAKKSPPAAISILSSATAGCAMGGLRSIAAYRMKSAGSSIVGREVAGATLYFSLYDGVKYLLVNEKERNALNPLATIVAGSLAGVVYDTVRAYGQQVTAIIGEAAVPLANAQTRSLASLAVRSAPSHALLFVGFEATLRLVSSSQY